MGGGGVGKIEVFILMSYFHTLFHMLRKHLKKRIANNVDFTE